MNLVRRRWENFGIVIPQTVAGAGGPVKAALVEDAADEDDKDFDGGGEDDPKLQDVRTLKISRDGQGGRWKDWKEAVAELMEDSFDDWPVEDIRTFLSICNGMARDGLPPRQWVERYLSIKKYSDTDRSQHELRTMAEYIEFCLCYDQLNGSSLVVMELIARRWQLIIWAHEGDALKPSYEGSEFFSGLKSFSGIDPAFATSVNRQMKDRMDRDKHRAAAGPSNRGLPAAKNDDNKGAAKGGGKRH